MQNKINVGILFGGKSTEHEISVLSAKSIYEAIDKDKYNVILIGINQQGHWSLVDDQTMTIPSLPVNALAIVPGQENRTFSLVNATNNSVMSHLDVVFPVLHGISGEDGSIQGLLQLAHIPYVGANVLGSAIGMDKDVMKRLLRDAGINVSKFLIYYQHEKKDILFSEVCDQLGLPFFIKPANTGSSVGVNKIKNEAEFTAALEEAFRFDRKIIIEEYIEGREIECAVLGNEVPIASTLGEIIPHHEFYSYEAKYLDENGATLKIPAQIDEQKIKQFQDIAIQTFKILCCQGMARVDFFMRTDGVIFVNEINTIPGFTAISMYPALWQASGMSYTSLIDKLIELALQSFEQTRLLSTQFLTVSEMSVSKCS